jgi:hypothetical protein
MNLTKLSNQELQARIEQSQEYKATLNELAQSYHDLSDRQPEFAEKAEKYKVWAYDEATLLTELEAEKLRRIQEAQREKQRDNTPFSD